MPNRQLKMTWRKAIVEVETITVIPLKMIIVALRIGEITKE